MVISFNSRWRQSHRYNPIVIIAMELRKEVAGYIDTLLQLHSPIPHELASDLHALRHSLRSSDPEAVWEVVNKLASRASQLSRNKENVLKSANRVEGDKGKIHRAPYLAIHSTFYSRTDNDNLTNNKSARVDRGDRMESKQTDRSLLKDRSCKEVKEGREVKDTSVIKERIILRDSSVVKEKPDEKRRIEVSMRNNSSSSLRIKLKPKPTYEIARIRQNIEEVDRLMTLNDALIHSLSLS